MTKEEKQQLLAVMFQGADLSHAQIIPVAESGSVVAYNYNAASEAQKEDSADTSVEMPATAHVAEGDGEALVARLMPIFYNKEDDVRQFLTEIRGMADKDITDLVNRWVKEKRISDYGNSRKGDLWEVLNDAGLYKCSKSNWNGRVV